MVRIIDIMGVVQLRLSTLLIVSVPFMLARAQVRESALAPDVFQQREAGVSLNQQDILDGIAMLSHDAKIAVSVEHELGTTISGTAPQARALTSFVGPGSVSEILDGLCGLDETFVWRRSGNMVNVVPRALADDPNYFLNRVIRHLDFQGVSDARAAVFQSVDELSGEKEQVAVMEVGTSWSFAHPWTDTFQDVTVREALNLIARQLGPTYGWQLSGAKDFRIITFHQGLSPKPSRKNGPSARP